MSQVFDIADQYVENVARMSPLSATYMGVPGHDHRMNDFSPEAAEAEADLDRATLARLEAAPVEGDYDRIAREAMMDSLRLNLDRHDANEHFRSLSMIFSPIHSMRQVFDLMPRDTEEAWSNIASRMALIPDGIASYRSALQEGLERDLVVAKRQAIETADQCDIWNGSSEGHESFFEGWLNHSDSPALNQRQLSPTCVPPPSPPTVASPRLPGSSGRHTSLERPTGTQSDRNATPSPLAFTTASNSTCSTPTTGAGNSWPGWIPKWKAQPGRLPPVGQSRKLSESWMPTPTAPSKAWMISDLDATTPGPDNRRVERSSFRHRRPR